MSSHRNRFLEVSLHGDIRLPGLELADLRRVRFPAAGGSIEKAQTREHEDNLSRYEDS
jgi:hypothetical protein